MSFRQIYNRLETDAGWAGGDQGQKPRHLGGPYRFRMSNGVRSLTSGKKKRKIKIFFIFDYLFPSSVIQKTIKQLDDLLYTKLIDERYLHTGTTAVCVVYDSKYQALYFANLGDSRGILIRDNQLVFSTVDHKPETESEYERIIKIGGQVVSNRVNGALAVSRAFGDFNLKARMIAKQRCIWNPDNLELVLSEAEISLIPKTSMGEDMVICLACDGVFDVCSNEEVTEFVSSSMGAGKSLLDTSKRLVQHCFDKKSTDNISVIRMAYFWVSQFYDYFGRIKSLKF